LSDAKYYQWEDPILYKHYAYQIVRRCVPEEEITSILKHYHAREVGGHFGPTKLSCCISTQPSPEGTPRRRGE